jgi:peroxiredoxin
MVSLGTKAPDFTLPDTVSGKQLSLAQLKGNIATVIIALL